jgi:hypothetical protein
VRGSAVAQATYARAPKVDEHVMAILELNGNAGVNYDYVGYYPSTANNTYNETDGAVDGAKFATRFVRTFAPINEGMASTDLEQLRYIDEADGVYNETFPVSSILGLNRYGPGIVHLAADETNQPVPSPYCRLYCCEADAPYKYWRSAAPVSGVWNSSPFVKYSQSMWVNKIKVSVETHRNEGGAWRTKPLQYKVQILAGERASSGTWTTVFSDNDAGWPSDGILRLYYYKGDWTQTPSVTDIDNLSNVPINNAVKIFGLRVLVTEGPANAGLSFIELSPRLSLNVTDVMISSTTTQNLAEDDSALLVGSISSNTSEVTLSNYEGLLDFDNPGSILYSHEARGSNIDIYNSVELAPNQFDISRVSYGIIDEPTTTGDYNISFSCVDGMKHLQSVDIRGMLIMNNRISEIVRQLLDYAGVSDMVFNYYDVEDDISIPYYYVNEGTIYDAMADIASAYQAAMSFDSDNIFQVYTKEYLLDSSRVEDFWLRYDAGNSELPNIKSIERKQGKPVNDVRIDYKHHYVKTRLVEAGGGGKAMWWQRRKPMKESVWQAENSVLGAAALVDNLPASGATSMSIDQESGAFFGYTGYVMVDSEVIAYDAKQYFYRPYGSPNYTTVWVTSGEELHTIENSMQPESRLYFTGKLRIPFNGRGKFNSVAAEHWVDTSKFYPYTKSGGWSSWKTCPSISSSNFKIKYPNGSWYGSATWRYKGGNTSNLRGSVTNPGSVIRRGSNSAIRMTGTTKEDLEARGASNVWDAIAHSAQWYVDTVNNTNIIPVRVGAGIGMIGRSDMKAGYRPESRAGVGMWLYYTGSNPGYRLNGWTAEITPTKVAGTDVANVKIYHVINDRFHIKASGTAPIPLVRGSSNPTAKGDDNYYTHLELAYFGNFDGFPTMAAYVNGRFVCKYKITSADGIRKTAVIGPYVRSRTMADFDYVWWSNRSDVATIDGATNDSAVSWTKFTTKDALNSASGPPEWWDSGTRRLFGDFKNYMDLTNKYELMGLSEFGPMVHEVQIIRSEMDNAPVINPEPYGGYASEARMPVFRADPFKVEMVVANASRTPVILDETGRLGVVGYPIQQEDRTLTLDDLAFSGDDEAEVFVARAKQSEELYGKIPVEISSSLIQSRHAAKKLMRWILKNQTLNCDTLDAEVFGNPLIEPGDIVRVSHPELGVDSDDRWMVTSVTHSWEEGFVTKLTLRMVVNV